MYLECIRREQLARGAVIVVHSEGAQVGQGLAGLPAPRVSAVRDEFVAHTFSTPRVSAVRGTHILESQRLRTFTM